MTKLIRIVVNAPVSSGFPHEIRSYFCSDDFVSPAGSTVRNDRPIKVYDHSFTHAVETAIAATHAYIGCNHQIAQSIRLVDEAPALPTGAV
jgi:hypothetical protein